MNAVPQPQARGLSLLAQHLGIADADAPTARERLEVALGPELAHLLVFALGSSPDERTPAAA